MLQKFYSFILDYLQKNFEKDFTKEFAKTKHVVQAWSKMSKIEETIHAYLSAFRDRGVPKPTSECRRVPQPRWVDARPSAKGGREVAGDRRERGGNPAAFVFVSRPGRVRLQ
jgi:hypothetical protein